MNEINEHLWSGIIHRSETGETRKEDNVDFLDRENFYHWMLDHYSCISQNFKSSTKRFGGNGMSGFPILTVWNKTYYIILKYKDDDLIGIYMDVDENTFKNMFQGKEQDFDLKFNWTTTGNLGFALGITNKNNDYANSVVIEFIKYMTERFDGTNEKTCLLKKK